MTGRSSTLITDRIFGTLVYCFALYDTLSFSSVLLSQFPSLDFLLIPAFPAVFIYGLFGQIFGSFGSFIVFLILFLAVVRNERISHFIRYNAMQTILIGILLALLGLVMEWVLVPALGINNILMQTLFNVIFLGGLAASYYSMIQSALGNYAEMPTISEAAYSQVR